MAWPHGFLPHGQSALRLRMSKHSHSGLLFCMRMGSWGEDTTPRPGGWAQPLGAARQDGDSAGQAPAAAAPSRSVLCSGRTGRHSRRCGGRCRPARPHDARRDPAGPQEIGASCLGCSSPPPLFRGDWLEGPGSLQSRRAALRCPPRCSRCCVRSEAHSGAGRWCPTGVLCSLPRQAWDLAVDICLSQLPTIIEEGTAFRVSLSAVRRGLQSTSQVWGPGCRGVRGRRPLCVAHVHRCASRSR